MQYIHFKAAIRNELKRTPGGLTWAQLQSRLDLPYDRPCPTWTKQLEQEIGLRRIKGTGRPLIWQVGKRRRSSAPGI